MEQLGHFMINHWPLWLGFFSILLLIFINELKMQNQRAKEISPAAAVDLINHKNAVIFDIRSNENFHKGHIVNAIQMTSDELLQKSLDTYLSTPLILVCERGLQSAQLATKLRKKGLTQLEVLAGGMDAWKAAGLPIVKGK